MLKPKRKILSKEIERDPFLDWILSLRKHFNKTKHVYTRGALGLIAFILIGYLYSNSQSSNRSEAENIMSKAMVFVEIGDSDNAMIYFQELLNEYSSTISGKNASFYIGRIHFDNGEHSLAMPHLERYAKKGLNGLLLGANYEALVSIYQSKNDLDNAIRYQRLVKDNVYIKENGAWASLQLANLLIKNGENQEASKLVNIVLKDFSDNLLLKQKAEEIKGNVNTGEED